jgi:hypothetical protein
MGIHNFDNWNKINEESAPRLPIKEDYWLRKGKEGKKVALLTHDDLDGIACAVLMKTWLIDKGFEIIKYGVLNYTDGWKYTTLDPKLINIVLDFANMPGDERDNLVDYYLDHHGLFSAEELEKYKSSPVQKKKTASAYEALCQSLGVPQDELVSSVIDMVDAAKYQDYGVDWSRLLDFNLEEIKKSKNTRLEFAAAFNQFLKRSDTKTLISVIHNCKDASIYGIFHAMKKVYGEHNKVAKGLKKGENKDFIEDSTWRLGEMEKRTTGIGKDKTTFKTQAEFLGKFQRGGLIKLDGYQIIGDLAYVPTGTWANALRARTIIGNDFKKGLVDKEPKFILLQYGSTLQVCSFKKISETDSLPTIKGGVVDDLGKYMTELLVNFQKHLGYHDPNTSLGQDEITVSGGHGGIGSISNIFGICKVDPYNGCRFVDMFKNKIISDLSGVKLNLNIKWSEPSEYKTKEPEMNHKVINAEDVTKLDNKGNVIKNFENFEYSLIDQDDIETIVSKDDFIEAGAKTGMSSDKIRIDAANKKIVAKFEAFEMDKDVCDHCFEPTNGVTTMSMFDDSVICMGCKEIEKQDPEYKLASDTELEEVKKGNYNYKGIRGK